MRTLANTAKAQALRPPRFLVRRSPGWLLETLALFAVTLAGVGVLFVLDTALSRGLWGEWGFAFVVCWVATWLAGHALAHRFAFQPPNVLQALVWAAAALVGAPFAVMTRWWGVALFTGVLLAGLAILFVLRRRTPSWLPLPQWIAVALAVASVWVLVATRTNTDHAQIAAATRPVKDGLALAYVYRPTLRFDSRERYFPLNVDWAMQHSLVTECRYGVRATKQEQCSDVKRPADLDSSYDYLAIANPSGSRDVNDGGIRSGFYVHAVRKDREIFLDYWIYYTQNPNPFARGLFCAPGLQWGELTCFDHAGDWEGVVVTLQACSRSQSVSSICRHTAEGPMRIVAVSYAEHRGVTRFAWDTLASMWRRAGLLGGSVERPLVYVARDSHASYPRPCPNHALTAQERVLRIWPCGQDDANGHLAWRNNSARPCRQRCLAILPVDPSSGAPTSWDSFPGHWGKQSCILYGGYCDLGTAPRAPAFQGRYKEPWHSK